jgi:hypothetical protein
VHPQDQEREQQERSRRRAIVATLVLIPIGILLIGGLYLADVSDEWPWETTPTPHAASPPADPPATSGTPSPAS